jgi:hypothetical protein
MEEGQSLYAQKKYADAAQAFQRAYAAQPFAAFLFNEGVCHEKLGDLDRAIDTFKRYITVDPAGPDVPAVKARIARLEAERDARRGDGGPDAGPVAPPVVDVKGDTMRSLVLVESDPPGAPVEVWERAAPLAPPFQAGTPNPGWQRVSAATTPTAVTLGSGHFHVLIEKFGAFNRSETDLDVVPGRVHHFKANLSQGAFMGNLLVESTVQGAQVFVDDPPPHARPPWGATPHTAMLTRGEHTVWVEAPGFETFTSKVNVEIGQQQRVFAELARVSYGYMLFDGNAASFTVSVDGQPRGTAAAGAGPLRVKEKSGTHHVVAESEGKKPYVADVEIPAGQVVDVHVTFSEKYGRSGAWAAAISGGVLLGAGIGLGIASNGVHSDMEDDRKKGVLTKDDERGSRGKYLAYGADAALGIGGILGILAVYEFIRDPSPPSSATVDEPRDLANPKKRGAESSYLFGPAPVGGSGTGVGLWGRF